MRAFEHVARCIRPASPSTACQCRDLPASRLRSPVHLAAAIRPSTWRQRCDGHDIQQGVSLGKKFTVVTGPCTPGGVSGLRFRPAFAGVSRETGRVEHITRWRLVYRESRSAHSFAKSRLAKPTIIDGLEALRAYRQECALAGPIRPIRVSVCVRGSSARSERHCGAWVMMPHGARLARIENVAGFAGQISVRWKL